MTTPAPVSPRIIHASAVAVEHRGLLILGRSGSGKSTLALQMMALGADLIADDRTWVTPDDGALHLSPHSEIEGMIEARGMGILQRPFRTATAHAVCDLSQTETERLPPARETVIDGCTLPLFYRVDTPAFASMLLLHLRSGLTT